MWRLHIPAAGFADLVRGLRRRAEVPRRPCRLALSLQLPQPQVPRQVKLPLHTAAQVCPQLPQACRHQRPLLQALRLLFGRTTRAAPLAHTTPVSLGGRDAQGHRLGKGFMFGMD